jgi:DNA-binding transcriptional ArsR family regulator
MYNPYNYHVAVRDDAMFFGREEILGRLVSGLSAPVPLSAAIFGGRRSGKTSLLSKLRRMLSGEMQAAGERHFAPCSLDLQRGRRLTCSDDFFLWVLEELGEVWEIQHDLEPGLVVDALQKPYRDELRRGPVDAFVSAFRSLDTRGRRIRVVIMIDESEGILTVEWSEDVRPNLRYLLSGSPIVEDVALVMAGSTQMYTKVTERDSPLENILDRYCLGALSREATASLAQKPNDNRLPEKAAEEVWRQTGGHPCMTQYILHELWDEFKGELENTSIGDVQDVAETFDDWTRHFSMWTRTLGQIGNDLYNFLAEQNAPVTYSAIRQRFSEMTSSSLQSTLDALYYHGLIHCHGKGRRQRYQVAGRMFRDWFLTAGKLGATVLLDRPQVPSDAPIVVHGDYVAGDKPTGVDQRGQDVHGPQTNIAGDVSGPIASGQFDSATTVGGGEATDHRGQEAQE